MNVLRLSAWARGKAALLLRKAIYISSCDAQRLILAPPRQGCRIGRSREVMGADSLRSTRRYVEFSVEFSRAFGAAKSAAQGRAPSGKISHVASCEGCQIRRCAGPLDAAHPEAPRWPR